MQSMAIKHSTRRCDFKRYAKRVLFKVLLRYFGPKMRLLRAPNRVHNTLNDDERCLFII